MGKTKVLFNKELVEKLKEGVSIIGDAVGATLGYNGRNVLIPETDPEKIGRHKITKDGVSVAKSIATLDHPMANAAAQMIKDVAGMTHKLAGDGTTTATVLAQSIFIKGLNFLKENPDANPIELNNGIQYAAKEVVEVLKKAAIHIHDQKDKLIQVATIAANNDREIGELVGSVMAELGQEGIVNVEVQLYRIKTEYQPTLGFKINSGYINEWLVNDRQKRTCQFQQPLILLCEDKLSLFNKEVHPAMKIAEKNNRPLLIIAENIDGEALNTVITNASRKWPICAIRIPAVGAKKLELLKDIQATVGGTIFSNTAGNMLEFIEEKDLGNCERCEVFGDSTQLFGGLGSKEELDLRVGQLRGQLDIAQSDPEIRWLKNRITTLTTKRGTIYAGGNSDIEKKELADRIDDAICACRSAMEEGVLPGGGIALVRCNAIKAPHDASIDFKSGVAIVFKAKEAPFRKIISNSGMEPEAHLVECQKMDPTFGYNSKTRQWEDLVQNGIIDPVKVTRVALENAASIAGALLTATCGVYYE